MDYLNFHWLCGIFWIKRKWIVINALIVSIISCHSKMVNRNVNRISDEPALTTEDLLFLFFMKRKEYGSMEKISVLLESNTNALQIQL